LLAYFSNYRIAELGLGTNDWRWMFGVAAVPAVLFLIMLFGIPRSPRWLATQNRVDEARVVLQMMGSQNAEGELREIVESIHLERAQKSEPLFSWKYRLPIFLAITIGLFNQLAGINAILYYLNDIFTAAGFTKVSGELGPVAVGAMNLFATILAMTVIDKLGRKTLLLIGSVGLAGCLSGLATIFLAHNHQQYLLWLLIAYIGFFAISQGAVIWVYIGEVFPNPRFDFRFLDQVLAQGSWQCTDCRLPQKLNPWSPFDQAPGDELLGEAYQVELHHEVGQLCTRIGNSTQEFVTANTRQHCPVAAATYGNCALFAQFLSRAECSGQRAEFGAFKRSCRAP